MTHLDRRPRSLASDLNIALLVALLATALALGAALAHAYELPNKIGLARDAYFTVQGIYRGWNLLAIVLLVQLISMIAVAWRYRRRQRLRNLAFLAIGGLVAAQVVFWIWTFPANQATNNWTEVTDNWEALRRNWEYSHLAGAIFQLVSFLSLVVLALLRGRPQ